MTPSTDLLSSPARPPLRNTLGLVTLAWLFGAVWITAVSGAPITMFAKNLGASEFQFGLLSALPFIASLLSLPASLLTERTGQRKKIFLYGLYTQRLLWFPIALVPLWIVSHYGLEQTAPIAMGLAIVLIFIMHSGQAIGGPAWVTWMADLVPDRARGKYFARRRQWGILSAIPAALLAGWLLDRHASSDPLVTLRWCAIIFMGAAVFGFMDIHLFQWVPDVPKPPQRGQHLLRALHEPLRNRQFLWFAGFVAMITFAVSFMGQFVTLYVIDKVGVNGIGTQLMLLVAPMAVQLLVLPAWGKAADRMGKKPLLAIAALGLVPVGLGWCLLGPHNVWLGYVLSILGSALWTGIEVANFNLVLEMSGSDDSNGKTGGTSYVAVNSIIINIAGCAGGLASGVIAQWLRHWHWDVGFLGLTTIGFYEVLFILSGVLRLLSAVIFLPFIHEPEARPTHEALRFMTSNIYNNLFNAILQPLRFVGLAKADVDARPD